MVFHSTLYDWLVEKGSADELLDVCPPVAQNLYIDFLQIDTPFLEGHLQREPLSMQNGELLWQYYVKSGQYLKAAQTLEGLAESTRYVEICFRKICLPHTSADSLYRWEGELNSYHLLLEMPSRILHLMLAAKRMRLRS
jgi:hypothetical protein